MLPREVNMKIEDCLGRDINIAEVARQMKFARSYVQNVMAGRCVPSIRFMDALEKVDIESVRKKNIRLRRILTGK
jgi:hypothetical protein